MYWFKIATPGSGHQTNDNVPILLTTGWDVFTLYCNSKLCFLITPIVEFWCPQLINSELKAVRYHGPQLHTSFTTALQILTGGILIFINEC